MKKIIFYFLIGIFTSINVACENTNDINLYLNNHLNDSEHINNPDSRKQKEAVLNTILQFDNWYRKNYGEIEYQDDVKFWNIGWNINANDEYRISFLKDSIIPRFLECEYLTKLLKEKITSKGKAEDPGNIGYIISESNYGKSLSRFTAMNNSEEYYIFHTYNFLDNEEHSDDPDFRQDLRGISNDEAKFYHLSFIKIVNDKKAIYKVHTDITNNYIKPETFLIVELELENNEWLINDLHYIEPDQLIENEKGYCTLIDYVENN